MKKKLQRVLLLFLLISIAQQSSAQYSEVQKIINETSSASFLIGRSVAVEGTTVVIGMPDIGNGIVFVYESGNLEAVLNASDGAFRDRFGESVSISGNTIVVGATQNDETGRDAGAVYIYEKGAIWPTTETAKLITSNGEEFGNMGVSVDISENVIVTGAVSEEDNVNFGAVYIYEKGATWPTTETAKILSPQSFQNFGLAVGVSDGTIVIGAKRHNGANGPRGTVYLYEKGINGWPTTETLKLFPTNIDRIARFGSSLDILGNTLVVGASEGEGSSVNTGSAYIFEKGNNGWTSTETTRIISSDGIGSQFGASIAIFNETIAVGASREFNDNGVSSGAVYIYEKGATWPTTETQKLTASDGAQNDQFGYTVGISEQIVAVGSLRDDNENGTNAGAVYLFESDLVCPNIDFTVTKQNQIFPLLSDGQITITSTVGGIAPYQYSIDGGTTFQTGTVFSSLAPDTYSVIAKDVNGCESEVHEIIIEAAIDNDNDGFPVGQDCDDNNPDINPAAIENICDGIDNNCDGDIDLPFTTRIFISTKNNIILPLDNNGTASISPEDIDNGTTATCGIESITIDKQEFSCDDLGNNTIIFTVADNNGFQETEEVTVLVVDNISPSLVLTSTLEFQLQPDGTGIVAASAFDLGTTDNCQNATLAITEGQTSFTLNDAGQTFDLTITATDVSGNNSSQSVSLTVKDDNVFIDNDNDGFPVGQDCDDNNPEVFPGAIENLCDGIDNNCDGDIDLIQTVLPTIQVKNNIILALGEDGTASISAQDVDDGTAAVCTIESLSISKETFDCTNLGNNQITFTVTDVNGSQTSTEVNLTVIDNIAPIVITQNVDVNLDVFGNASITPAEVDNGSTDNCGIESIVLDKTTFGYTDIGANTVILTVTDESGNVNTATAAVNVIYNDGAIAHWPLNNSTDDVSGNNQTIVLNGAAYNTDAIEGAASLSFDGVDDFVDLVGNTDNSFLHDEFTQRSVILRVKAENSVGTQILFEEGGRTNGIAIRIQDGNLEARAQINSNDNVNISTSFGDTDWVTVALTFDNGNMKLYLNGVLTDEVNASFVSVLAHSNGAGLGGSNESNVWRTNDNHNFKGLIDDVRIYDVSLTTEQIEEIYGEEIKLLQSIAFQTIDDKDKNAAPFLIDAVATSGLPVSYNVVEGPATMSGNTVILTGALGLVTIEASQEGNEQYAAAASVIQSFLVVDNPAVEQNLVLTTGEWQTITLDNNYTSPIVVATVQMPSTTASPVVTRIRNITSNSFDLKLQNPGGFAPVSSYYVHYVVAEEGSYTEEVHGVKMEAFKVDITTPSNSSNWDNRVLYTPQNIYDSPVLLGQVISFNDANWSSFFGSGTNFQTPASNNAVYVGYHVGEDPLQTRNTETIGCILIEAGSGTLEGRGYTAAVGGNTITGPDAPIQSYTVNSVNNPLVGILSAAGMNGANGGWPVLSGELPFNSGEMSLFFDEDQVTDDERTHTREEVSYLVFEAPANRMTQNITFNGPDQVTGGSRVALSATASSGLPTQFSVISGPGIVEGNELKSTGFGTIVLRVTQAGDGEFEPAPAFITSVLSVPKPVLLTEVGSVANASSIWQTIPLTTTFESPVIVANLVNNGIQLPAVVRIRNASSNSFEMKVQNPSGAALSGYQVNYIVVEEGIYTPALHGIQLEASTFNSVKLSGKNDWNNYEVQNASQTFTNPVVLGQVMTTNDANWSTFWSSSANSFVDPVNANIFNVSRHIGEDPNKLRFTEKVGYLVIEGGNGSINGMPYFAGISNDFVRGYNNTVTGYPLPHTVPTANWAITNSTGMDGGDGGFSTLFGNNAITPTAIQVIIDEDQLLDVERTHTTEQVAYFVLSTTVAPTNTRIGFNDEEQKISTKSIQLYPNPATSNLKMANLEGFDILQVYNLNGQLIEQKNIENDTTLNLNISSYSRGQYLVRFIGKEVIENKKFIVR